MDRIKKNFGFGAMRLPMKGGEVDIPQTCQMVDAFLEAGFNYFDTAHGYLDGKSEPALKACLTSRYPRDRYVLTTKLTGYLFQAEADIRPLFQKQLEDCGADYFDFYLMHTQSVENFAKFKQCRAYETALELEAVDCVERGPVFTLLRLRYSLPGTVRADVYVTLYEALPRLDFRLELGKTLTGDIESVFLPLSLDVPEGQLYLRKGGKEAFRPGVDQLPGACMEFYMSDDGLAYVSRSGSALIAARDVPLVYMGEMRHHPIRLCEGKAEDNRRPVYSWVMNNNWETNFKMDLSGYCEYCYSLWLSGETDPERAMDELREDCFDPYVLVVEQEADR